MKGLRSLFLRARRLLSLESGMEGRGRETGRGDEDGQMGSRRWAAGLELTAAHVCYNGHARPDLDLVASHASPVVRAQNLLTMPSLPTISATTC